MFSSYSRFFIVFIAVFNVWMLISNPFISCMMHGMMGHGKGGSGSSNVEAMLVAGILAKLLSEKNKNDKDQMAHPMYVPMPMMFHHMSTPSMMNVHMPSMPMPMGYSHMGGGMGGGYGMGGMGGMGGSMGY